MTTSRILKSSLLATFVAAACAGLVGCGSDDNSSSNPGNEGSGGSPSTGGSNSAGSNVADKSIVEIATSTPDLSILAAAVVKAGLVDALGADNLTVFAPTNAAFSALLTAIGKTSLDDLTADQLGPILKYHVVASKVDGAAAMQVAMGDGTVQTLGGTAKIAKMGDGLVLDGAAKVTTANVMAKNGVMHVIDHVMMPSITDLVVSTPTFSSLKTALTVADSDSSSPNLIGAFDDDTASLTLLVPNDLAFSGALTANSLADLPALVTAVGGTTGLVSVLKYHAASGRLVASDVVAAGGKSVPTLLAGSSFAVTVSGGSVMLNQGVDSGLFGTNDSKVITTDLYTSNGVVHVIDKVIAPAK